MIPLLHHISTPDKLVCKLVTFHFLKTFAGSTDNLPVNFNVRYYNILLISIFIPKTIKIYNLACK